MAEVKDEARAGAGLLEDALCFDTGDLRRGGQCDGVEVALDRDALVEGTAQLTQVHCPVEAEDGCARANLVVRFVAHTFGVQDHWDSLFKFSNDVANPAQ